MAVELASQNEPLLGGVYTLDGLAQGACMCFHAFGLSIGVRTNHPEVLPCLLKRLPPGWQPSRAPFVNHLLTLHLADPDFDPLADEGNCLLDEDGKILARSRHWEELLDALESEVQIRVAEHAPEFIFVHAGVVAWRGRALLLPGRSWSGKSTLVASLLCAGATYYSDEYAVLDHQGRTYPYPRRLALRGTEGTVYRRGPEAFGSQPGSGPLPVGLIAALSYRLGAHWRARKLKTGQAILELLTHTVSARSRPEQTLAVLQRLTWNCPLVRGIRGEAGMTASILLHLLDGSCRRDDPSVVAQSGEEPSCIHRPGMRI